MGISMPKSPRATMIPSDSARILRIILRLTRNNFMKKKCWELFGNVYPSHLCLETIIPLILWIFIHFSKPSPTQGVETVCRDWGRNSSKFLAWKVGRVRHAKQSSKSTKPYVIDHRFSENLQFTQTEKQLSVVLSRGSKGNPHPLSVSMSAGIVCKSGNDISREHLRPSTFSILEMTCHGKPLCFDKPHGICKEVP